MPPAEPAKRSDDDESAPKRSSFFNELRKRQVFQSALAYGVIAWGATEMLDGVISRFGWPDWLATLVVILFVVGLPVAMFLAWVFDWTPEGIRRDEPWTNMDRASVVTAIGLLTAGTAGLFWLINPGGVAHLERVGVAVLPCRYQGPEEYAFRAEGMAGAIEDRLALLRKLRVPSFSSVLRSAAQRPSTAEIGRHAGVDWLVECRMSGEDNLWRIQASLVEVRTDQSDLVISLDGTVSELYTRLDPIAQSLASKLGVVVTAEERESWAARSTGVSRTFDAYLRGVQAMRLGTAAAFRVALDAFRQAQEGPPFALAQVLEAEALMGLLESEEPTAERDIAARLRAVGLLLESVEAKNPELAELYAARMRLQILSARLGVGDPPQESRQRAWFERAVELKPSYAEPYRRLAEVLANAGKPEESEELLASMRVLDPGEI